MTTPLASHDYQPGGLDAAMEFVKRTRSDLRTLRRVRLWKDRLEIIDVNKDWFEVREGEATVFRPDGFNKLIPVARVQAADWIKAAGD